MRLSGRSITFAYGDQIVLNEVSLDVQVGAAVAVIGPSGVGKTTLLSVLGGMQKPMAGSVEVDGDSDTRKYVSWVLQTVNVFPRRTVEDNTALGALADGMSRIEAIEIAREKLGQVGLLAVASTQARHLSGGELQRVVVARGLASRRPFMLADEPTGQLDSMTTRTVVDVLLATRRERGLVVVTHDEAIAKRCDGVFHLTHGSLQARSVDEP